MADTYEVVTDITKIAKLNAILGTRLKKFFSHKESREVTWPAGHFTADVYFASKRGLVVNAWLPLTDATKLHNTLLVGEPGASAWMDALVQLHFPAGKYSRGPAGVFINDSNGNVFIGHRGKLAKGRGALKQRDTFREFAAQLIQAEDGDKTSNFILVSSLDAPDLADRLWAFALEAPEVATRLGAIRDAESATDLTISGSDIQSQQPTTISPATTNRANLLRKYFDEFSGTSETKGYGGGKRTVEHGDIVSSLKKRFADKGDTQKSQPIDLAVVYPSKVDLFEVKTSARTTDVYTGLGQLFIHGEALAELLKLPVARYLILPEPPKNKDHARLIATKGRIVIVTYQRINNGYDFVGF